MHEILKKRILWSSMVAVIITFIFWGFWHMEFGEIPTLAHIKLTEKTMIQLPPISRIWDIAFAPVWALILVPSLIHNRTRGIEHSDSGLRLGFLMGVFCSFPFVFSLEIAPGLTAVSVLCLMLVMLVPILTLGIILGFSLMFGLIFGLLLGLATALILSVAFAIFFVIAIILKNGIRYLFLQEKGATS